MRIHRCGLRAALLAGIVGTTLPVHLWSATTHAADQHAAPATIRHASIGESVEGRPIDLLTLSTNPEEADQRPALLIVAGVDATHQTGIAVARQLAERIAADHADLLASRTVYIVPLVNPDASARRSQGPIGSYDLRLAPKAIDEDRDRRIDEDGPSDINRDGYITQMRVRDPSPGSGLVATHVEHEDDPRLLRPADASKGETPVYAVMIEGVDRDGDGRVGEDPIGGIDLSRHFPYRWDEFDPVTGDYPLEDPGARALANWMLERKNLIAVLTYGPHDTLSSLPTDGKFDDSRRVPLGIESDDKAAYEKVQKA
ncbi:MAG: M14 family zinc carboxypeptidase, partial [Phycisphaerales bacterium JB065]